MLDKGKPAALTLAILLLPVLASTSGRADVDEGIMIAGSEASAESPDLGPRYAQPFVRATSDRPDTRSGPLLHVVYLKASDYPDESLDINGVIDVSMRSINYWLSWEAGVSWRVDSYSSVNGTAVDVTFIASALPAAQLGLLNQVRDELQAASLNDPSKRYLAYVAGRRVPTPNVCGSGYFPGRYAMVFLFPSAECNPHLFAPTASQPSWVEATAMQEVAHNDGVVPTEALHECPARIHHVCTPGSPGATDPERIDAMFYATSLKLSDKHLDVTRDDYFGHPFAHADLKDSPFLESNPSCATNPLSCII